MQYTNVSSVARLKQQIEAEYASGKLALEGFTEGVPQHRFITARMESMGVLFEQLKRADEKEAGKFLMGLQ